MTGAKSAMDLTILQAAQVLGKSPRQIRTMIQNGEITAARRGRMFFIDQATLPLSGGQAAAVERRALRAQEVVEEVFEPLSRRRRYSLRDLKAVKIGLPLYQEVVRELDAAHPAAAALRKVLAHLGRGCHRYRGPDKVDEYLAARDAASEAAVELALVGGALAERLLDTLEQDLLAALVGLIRRAEGRDRP